MIRTSFENIKQDIILLQKNLLINENIIHINDSHQKSGLYTMLAYAACLHKIGFNLKNNFTCYNKITNFFLQINDNNGYNIFKHLDDINMRFIFNHYLYYYSYQRNTDIYFVRGGILFDKWSVPKNIKDDINKMNYIELHKFIIEGLENHIFVKTDEYSAFTFAIIKDPARDHTLQLIDLLINNKYTITNKDINFAKSIAYNYILNMIEYNNAIIFISGVDLLFDVKSIISDYLLLSTLYNIQPNYYRVYIKLINYYLN